MECEENRLRLLTDLVILSCFSNCAGRRLLSQRIKHLPHSIESDVFCPMV